MPLCDDSVYWLKCYWLLVENIVFVDIFKVYSFRDIPGLGIVCLLQPSFVLRV